MGKYLPTEWGVLRIDDRDGKPRVGKHRLRQDAIATIKEDGTIVVKHPEYKAITYGAGGTRKVS